MSKIINHFKTVSAHRKAVRQLMFKLGPSFYLRGLAHDLSKYSFAEFAPSVHYWTGTYSPTINERKEKGYSSSWLHHKGRNKHHYEYWTDYSDSSSGLIPALMPAKYFCEMICDRIAASKTYLKNKYTPGAPYQYFLDHMKPEDVIHPVVRQSLEICLKYMKYFGEDKMFEELRQVYAVFPHNTPAIYTEIIKGEKYFNFDSSF